MQLHGTESRTSWRLSIPYSGTSVARRTRESSMTLRALYDTYWGHLLYFLVYYTNLYLLYLTLTRQVTCHT